MAVTIQLPSDIESIRRRQAQAQHLDLPTSVEALLRTQANSTAANRPEPPQLAEDLPFEQRRKNLQVLLKSCAAGGVALPMEAMPRDSKYAEDGV